MVHLLLLAFIHRYYLEALMPHFAHILQLTCSYSSFPNSPPSSNSLVAYRYPICIRFFAHGSCSRVAHRALLSLPYISTSARRSLRLQRMRYLAFSVYHVFRSSGHSCTCTSFNRFISPRLERANPSKHILAYLATALTLHRDPISFTV
ncbi:hypothetical protein C8Q79DRAFT_490363 [Trametes meyenii]|nr:hypothetical protein C8Q79DRAFT_490363 [Trametes meyenii]